MKFQPVKYFTQHLLLPITSQAFEARYNTYSNKLNEIMIPNFVFQNRKIEVVEVQKRYDGIYFIVKEIENELE
jgi:hypothetical protein